MAYRAEEASPTPGDVLKQVNRIVESADFQTSPRNRSFLRYVAEETLAGRDAAIKAYSIALHVFGRPESFDPAVDPIVRIEAGKLRKALERYYLTAGASDPVRIEIPKGTYVPTFATASTLHGEIPRVAVLPFALLGEDPSQSHFARGLSVEIAAALDAYPSVIVSCRYATPRLESHSRLDEYERELNARFVLEGIVRRSSDRVRITAQLHDLDSERQIWSQMFDRKLNAQSLFDIEDEIVWQVVESVAGVYGGAIANVVRQESRSRPNSLSAYEAVLHQHEHNQTVSPETYARARAALENAVELDPDYPDAWASLGELKTDAYALGYSDALATVEEAVHCARTALELDPNCRQAQFVLGLASLVLRDPPSVERAAEALLAPPTSPSTTAWAGWLLALVGQWERGLGLLMPRLELHSGYPAWLHHAPFLDHYRRGRYEAALQSARRFDQPRLFWDPLDRAAALGQLGRVDEALAAIDQLLSLQPKFAADPRRFLRCFIFQEELVEHVLQGLHKAGFGAS